MALSSASPMTGRSVQRINDCSDGAHGGLELRASMLSFKAELDLLRELRRLEKGRASCVDMYLH
jgi:hypothetical protein